MNKEGIEIMSDMNLQIDNQKEKYEKFKKKITKYIYENIMEQLEYDEAFLTKYVSQLKSTTSNHRYQS